MVQRCGGVGRNHADALTRLGVDVHLISALGNDSFADFIRMHCQHMVCFKQQLYHLTIILSLNTSIA
ncbi:unnamed protein product [Anisakis simplex]|uniref:PfkB domain-containing protein n=1 Tax=Anisakis simplex TaxID=6269 RepID=A0A0M3JJC4_ANISI|nr:unnamed protein product [Anisakis simplex]